MWRVEGAPNSLSAFAPCSGTFPLVFFNYSNRRSLCITLGTRNFSHCGAERFEVDLDICAELQ